MSLSKYLAGIVGFAALMILVGSAHADDYVYGSSSGTNSSPLGTTDPPNGNFLALTYGSSGTLFAPLGTYSLLSQTNLILSGDSGWFTGTTESGPGIDTYVTGNIAGSHYRSFLSFNTAGLQAGVTSASLVLDTYSVLTPGTETVDFLGGINYVNTTNPSASTTDANYVLSTEQNVSPAAGDIANIYNALGLGPTYGTFGYTSADANTQQTIGLDANFLSDINQSLDTGNSLFTIGEDDVLSTGSSVPLPSPLLGGAVLIAGLAMTRFLTSRRVAAIA